MLPGNRGCGRTRHRQRWPSARWYQWSRVAATATWTSSSSSSKRLDVGREASLVGPRTEMREHRRRQNGTRLELDSWRLSAEEEEEGRAWPCWSVGGDCGENQQWMTCRRRCVFYDASREMRLFGLVARSKVAVCLVCCEENLLLLCRDPGTSWALLRMSSCSFQRIRQIPGPAERAPCFFVSTA